MKDPAGFFAAIHNIFDPETGSRDVSTSLPGPLRSRSTQKVSDAAEEDQRKHRWLRTGYEIQVTQPDGAVYSIPLNFETVQIGRPGERANDIQIESTSLLNEHCTWTYYDGQFTVRLDSPHAKVLVNNEVVRQERELADLDIIMVGDIKLELFKLQDVQCEMIVVKGPDQGRQWKVNRSRLLIGRRGLRHNDLELSDRTVSRAHARMEFQRYTYVIIPESTANPVLVNGEPLSGPRPLEDHDQITVGETTIQYTVASKVSKRSLRPRDATILFSDLRGYSSLAERYPLMQMIDQLNEYLNEMGEIITVHGGTLLSYQGDAIMAVFGAPNKHVDDPERAINSAIQMLHRLETLNERWKATGRPSFHAGIGINTGVVMVGDIGNPQHTEYAALGDDTNVAARLEEMTRIYPADIIISEKTYEKIQGKYDIEPLGEGRIRGREQPMNIFKVLVPPAPQRHPAQGLIHKAPETTRDDEVLDEEGGTVLVIQGERLDPEKTFRLRLRLQKTALPTDDPHGVWSGNVLVSLGTPDSPVQYVGSATATIDGMQAFQMTSTGEVQMPNQPPTPWTLSGTGEFHSSALRRTVTITFQRSNGPVTWSFPVTLCRQ